MYSALCNLTDRPLTILDVTGAVAVCHLPSVGFARVVHGAATPHAAVLGYACGVPLLGADAAAAGGRVEGLPEPCEGVLFIVTSPAADVLRSSRADVARPGRQVFDAYGRVIGCRGLELVAPRTPRDAAHATRDTASAASDGFIALR